jgi:NAD(P)-dependent dehydrogenase (short-subunit alcohol dehydrogenase family)
VARGSLFSLSGKRALVTGAGRGIGQVLASAMADAGAEVVLVARSSDEVEAAAIDIRGNGHIASSIAADVTDTRSFRAAIDRVGPFDIFLNNAGMNRPQAFQDVTEENFDAILNLNLRAAFFAAQAVARGMMHKGGGGSIINMSSQMGHVGGALRSAYCASKFALEGMTKAAAIDLAPHGIRVNTICPTFIETPMTREFFEDETFKASVLAKIKLGRLGRPEDLIGAVVLLAGDASSLITGTHIIVDGGWTAE